MPYNLNKEFYSIREAAKFLSIRPKIVEALCLAGELEFIKDKNGKPIRIARASIHARARQNAEEAKERAFNLTTYKTGDYTKLLWVI